MSINLKINLYDEGFCDGCPCLRYSAEKIDSVRHYSAGCMHYIERDEHNNTWPKGLKFENGRCYSRSKKSPVRLAKCICGNNVPHDLCGS